MVRVWVPASTGERLNVATPFDKDAVAVIVIGLMVGIFVVVGTMTFQDVKLTVTVPVGVTPVPLAGATVTVKGVFTTCARLRRRQLLRS